MKILQLIQKQQPRGAEIFACQLANHLIEQGNEVRVVAIFPGNAELPFKGEIRSLNGSPGKRFADFSAWKALARIIREFGPDILQANAGDTLKYAVLSRMCFGWSAPVIFRNASEVGRYLGSGLQRKFNAFLYGRVEGIISVSRASRKDLLAHFPGLEEKTTVIPVGLEQHDHIEKIPLKSGIKHLIHVGGFSFEKNHQGLLRIFQRVLEKTPGSHLHLVGDGPLRPAIEEKVRQLGLMDRVSFHGFVKDPLSYIKAGDVLVLPSVIEGLPGVLLEAMYCKVPVVAYDVGGISEIVTPSTGKLVKKNDEEEFAERIQESLEQNDQGQVEQAYTLVRDAFMNEKLATDFLQFYTWVKP